MSKIPTGVAHHFQVTAVELPWVTITLSDRACTLPLFCEKPDKPVQKTNQASGCPVVILIFVNLAFATDS